MIPTGFFRNNTPRPVHAGARRVMVAAMIVSASYRTDIPALYGDSLMKRLAAGRALVANPYGGNPYSVSLAPGAVDGFVFWTRNIGPLHDRLGEIASLAPFMVQFTVTGYPRALEPGVIETAAAIAQIRALANSFGRRATVWRYDPIIETSLTPPAWHRENFARLAAMLEGYVDEVTVSFAQIYTKTARNMNVAAHEHGFTWRDPEDEEKRALAGELAAVAAGRGMCLTVCSQSEYTAEGAASARCIDANRLSDLAGRDIVARVKGNRPGCLCHESRDIGAYDSCPQGCAYCYAVSNRGVAKRFLSTHDPKAASLSSPGIS
jgi:hypothetical protein